MKKYFSIMRKKVTVRIFEVRLHEEYISQNNEGGSESPNEGYLSSDMPYGNLLELQVPFCRSFVLPLYG